MLGEKNDTKLKLLAGTLIRSFKCSLGAERSVDIEAYKAELPTWHSHLLTVLGTNFSKQRQGTRPSTSRNISSPPYSPAGFRRWTCSCTTCNSGLS